MEKHEAAPLYSLQPITHKIKHGAAVNTLNFAPD